jgi:hypothetical protein
MVTLTAAQYRLLYAQPDPERGERVCVGILYQEGNRFRVDYDREFGKIRCLAPYADTTLLSFLLEDLSGLLSSTKSVELAIGSVGPHIAASEARYVAGPVLDSTRQLMLERFVLPSSAGVALVALDDKRSRSKELVRQVGTNLADFAEAASAVTRGARQLLREARPVDVIGRRASIPPVAAALKTASEVVLIDGIDLNLMTPGSSVNHANKVVHTFWRYDRLRQEHETFLPQAIRIVGIVLNGTERARPWTKRWQQFTDAHDYAMDQFRQEADLAVDASKEADLRELHMFLDA